MEILFLLIGISLVVAFGFLLLFIFSTKDGQFDDMQTPAKRILFENNTKED